MAEVIRQPWMTDEMYNRWLDLYLGSGGDGVSDAAERATTLFRALPEYEMWFPGILRDDGMNRFGQYAEQEYFDNIASYRTTVEGLGLNPDVFNEDYIDLIRGDTSPLEFSQNANALYARVLTAGPQVKDWYASNFGLDMTSEGVLASLMSNRVEQSVLNRQITMAEIGGTAQLGGIDLSDALVTELVDVGGMDANEAREFFGDAQRTRDTIRRLAARHGDADDMFDIRDLAAAEGFLPDTEGAELTIERLGAQERSLFTGGADLDIARSRTGGATGLIDV